MKILCTDNKTFELKAGAKTLGRVIYNGVFSFKAIIEIGREKYIVTPLGTFSTTISVSHNGKEIASLDMNWKGFMTLSFHDKRSYVLRTTGTYHDKYVVVDAGRNEIIHLDPDFNWSKFSYDYSIRLGNPTDDVLLVLMAVYAANYHVAVMSSAVH